MEPHLDFERIYIDYPEFYGNEMITRHINRYEWASQYLKKSDTVLDAGCGSGYGSNLLVKKCYDVIGIDINKKAIDYAWNKYKRINLYFWVNDLLKIVTPENIDVIVCIEVIEHFTKDDAERIMSNFYQLLKNNGRLLLTTPNKNKSNGNNKYHKREYTEPEIKRMLRKHFQLKNIKTHLKNNFIYLVATKNGNN